MDNSLSKQRHEPPTRVLQYYYIRGNAFQDGGLTDGNYIKYYCYYCVPIAIGTTPGCPNFSATVAASVI